MLSKRRYPPMVRPAGKVTAPSPRLENSFSKILRDLSGVRMLFSKTR